MWITTYHTSLSLLMLGMAMKALSRWIDEMATMEAATFCLSEPESSLPSQESFSFSSDISMRETKFS